MVTTRGRSEVDRYFAAIPGAARKMLRGAGRAAAAVVSDEIKARTPSDDVRDNLRTRTSATDDTIRVTIDVKPGWGRSVGTWLEYGTAPHLISVDESQSQGRTAGRINRLAAESGSNHSLVIGGKFVGSTVMHPGARPHPAFRPALDLKEGEAIAAAQSYINSRVSRAGIAAETEGDAE